MVFRGTNLDPMFAAADANDGDLTSGIYNQHGGDGVPTLKQCRRSYMSAAPADPYTSTCTGAGTCNRA